MSKLNYRTTIVAGATLLAAAAVLAVELITVRVPLLDVWAKKGSMYGTVATLKQGDQLQVIEKQPDGWLRVAAGDKEGFIRETALVPPKSGGFGDAFKGMNVGRTDAADPSASNAARGIEPGATFYAGAKNLNVDGLQEMINARREVSGTRFEDFLREGNVGPAPK